MRVDFSLLSRERRAELAVGLATVLRPDVCVGPVYDQLWRLVVALAAGETVVDVDPEVAGHLPLAVRRENRAAQPHWRLPQWMVEVFEAAVRDATAART